ncbi:hypothetical protein BH11BAC4_BH11BAC4_02060 [soil metagenome]
MQSIILGIAGLVAGFIAAWVIRTVAFVKLKKAQQDTEGFLEREKLGKERLQRETESLYRREAELAKKMEAFAQLNKRMDEDILLLQKSNEETEALLNVTEPEVYALKLKLIEANNTIARMKAGTK